MVSGGEKAGRQVIALPVGLHEKAAPPSGGRRRGSSKRL